MKKLTLPLVMIASLATLASCGQKDNANINLSSRETPFVTGVVVTPTTSTNTSSVAPTPTGTATMTPVVGADDSATTETPVPPVVATRRETVSYETPEGMVPVEFDVTVTDGIITSASSKTLATSVTSKTNQDKFAKALSGQVVGKKAASLKLDAVGGASLTTAAFEQFVHSF